MPGGGAGRCPPPTALWVPPGVPRDIGSSRRSRMFNVYLDPDRGPPALQRPGAVAVTPLVRQLFLHLADETVAGEHRARAEELSWHCSGSRRR